MSRWIAAAGFVLFAGPLLADRPLWSADDVDARAAALVRRMSPDERFTLLHGPMAVEMPGITIPANALRGAGHVDGIPRLGIPDLTETDASLGVAWALGQRRDGATALPSALSMASTWSPALVREGGAMIGREAHAKGFNVLLAGGVNLVREPRGGRNFEYFGEDPLLSGLLAGAAISGIQSEHVVSTVKHFAFNAQETGRSHHDARIAESAARESDLLAFQFAIESGQPGAVMCAYNRVNSVYSCRNEFLLERVLKRDWRYKGWVMSDWGAVHGAEYAIAGLDQQSAEQLDGAIHFGTPLHDLAEKDPRHAARIEDMNRRILRSLFAVGLDRHPPCQRAVDSAAHAAVSEQLARRGIVLLRNEGRLLPLDADSLQRIAVIGGDADTGVPAGGGSSHVQGEAGPALSRPLGGDNPMGEFFGAHFHRSVPLKALATRAPRTKIAYRDGRHLAEAVEAARQADVAIVFATQLTTESLDVPDLSLQDGQDALIAAISAANPRTIVVLETGGPVEMPWLAHTPAVLEAWYPGARGADAIAAVLFGDENPSGRLPLSFPARVSQLPRPVLPGTEGALPEFRDDSDDRHGFRIDYDIEGSDVGYRWHARRGQQPLFWFGHGLSYTRFDTTALSPVPGVPLDLRASVRNAGDRPGEEVVQLYLIGLPGELPGQAATRRLLAFERLQLTPGETRQVRLRIDPRLLARWRDGAWHQAAGKYRVALGRSAGDLLDPVDLILPARHWTD
jgi:beta-glucosidase